MPKYILYDSELFTFNFIKKLYDVNDFINSNYEFHEKYLYWTFYKLKTQVSLLIFKTPIKAS